MKIIANLTDCSAAAHVGGDVERHSYIIDIPRDAVPKAVLAAISAEIENRKTGSFNYSQISLSLLVEEEADEAASVPN